VKNIFVGNLDASTTAASIRSLFRSHGSIEHLKLMTDKQTGLSRGFAFVEMTDAEADRAIAALNGSIVDGRAVDVHEGRPRLHPRVAPRERRVPRL
jgi:cold-inducible RNA-binding protein